ncbi:unnamed protein product [Rotaria magnacalcarata]|uniref:DDE Tnp4 domain-containing protein n=1 Tax=Rotaria magnacalcarata TaxID=392030 RepID=A0A819VVH5_9BILA|nr:unnamed protein product [Rotaria magnacalcarata]CAF4114947.1 unnamed protein product [Rotaria magnacalcarata]
MPHEYCPCGLVLYRSSTVRPLKTPCLRLFMSIRTMKTVTPETKICNACRTAYYDWKSRYPEFGNIFRRIEEELAEPDFDDPLLLSDDDYNALISLSKDQFNDLISHISKYDIRNSSNRFIPTVIALLLSKLRMELSNKLLATLFQLPDAKTVARTLKSGHNALMNTFVSYNLGLDHIARQKIIDQHTSTITRELMCNGERDKAGTSTMEELGLNAALPPFLNGRRQFTTAEANESRCVTKIRWIVETVNGRLKQFKFLSNTVQNFSIPHLEEYLSIACSIINRYQTPIKTSSLEDIEITKKNGRFAQSVKEFRNVSREK